MNFIQRMLVESIKLRWRNRSSDNNYQFAKDDINALLNIIYGNTSTTHYDKFRRTCAYVINSSVLDYIVKKELGIEFDFVAREEVRNGSICAFLVSDLSEAYNAWLTENEDDVETFWGNSTESILDRLATMKCIPAGELFVEVWS